MTSRDDVKVYYHLDPRLIVVATPSTEMTMQDLHDTLQDIDDEPANMVYPHLVESAGKEDLGGGVTVGITLTLQNAQIAFARRENILGSGTCTSDSDTGSTLQQIIDTSATFQSDSIARGMWVSNNVKGFPCEVVSVDSETQLSVLTSTLGDWVTGDTYVIWQTEVCDLTGGNLVAVDANGNTIQSVFPTYATSTTKTASSAATLQNTLQLEFATFDGGVHVNLGGVYSGTTYPIGTPQQPVNNFSDALTIMRSRGFTRLYVVGSATIDAGLNYSGLEIIGESPNKTIFTITSAADVTDSKFSNATIQGVLDGGNVLTDCSLLTINYVDGIIQRCLLLETVTLSGAATAFFLDCWSGVSGSQTPTIDMGGSGSELAIRNYSGGIKIVNRTGTDPVSIDMNSGQIIIDDTVTAGSITLRGMAKWTNEKTYAGGATINSELITFQDTQQLAFEGNRVHLDVNTGYTGTSYPRGTTRMPINNISDALIIASGQLIDEFHIDGILTIPSGTNISNKQFIGQNASTAIITIQEGAISTNTSFSDFSITGDLSGGNIIRDSIIQDLNNFDGVIHQSMIAGQIHCGSGTANILGCYQAPTILGSGIIHPNNSIGCNIQDWTGFLKLGSKTNDSETTVTLNGNVTIDNTAASGIIHMYGTGSWYNKDSYSGAATVLDHLISKDFIQDMGGTIATGYAISSTINGITLASDASITNGAYDPAIVSILSGTGAGQSRMIYQYDGTTQTAYVDRNWKVLPDTTSEYSIIANPGREHVNEGLARGGTLNTITLNSNASNYDDAYEDQVIFLRSGTGEDQNGLVVSYDGTTKIATLLDNWRVIPSGDTGYVMLPNYIHAVADVNVVQVSGVPVGPSNYVDANVIYASGVPVGPSNYVDANVIYVSGVPVGPSPQVDANVIYVSGVPVGPSPQVDANIIKVSGEPVSINDFVGEAASLTTDAIATAVWNSVIESGYTADETMKIMLSSLAGKLSGAGGTTIRIRDVNDTKDRIVAVVDADGNRATITLDAT